MAAPGSSTPTVNQPRALRLYLGWTVALAVTALAGAGLAVAADRPGNPVERPELTYRADAAAQPWIDRLGEDLDAAQTDAKSLSSAGRDVLGSLQALDLAGVSTALVTGDQVTTDISAVAAGLHDMADRAQAAIDRWRLGPPTVSVLDQIDAAIAGTDELPANWSSLAATARTVTGLVQALGSHDQAVSQAAAAGRGSDWAGALVLLNGPVATALGRATDERDQLAQSATVAALDDLLARERAYDAALIGLYQYLATGGSQSGSQFEGLQNAAVQAHAALPKDNGALVGVVGESAGPSIADRLLAMDEARGSITDALEAISDAKFGAPAP